MILYWNDKQSYTQLEFILIIGKHAFVEGRIKYARKDFNIRNNQYEMLKR